MTIVNAGHPPPFLLREGTVSELALEVDRPCGLEPGRELRVQRVQLERGDRVVLLTDGMLERNAQELDLWTALHREARTHPRELVYLLAETVLHATGGNLDDDATILCLDWRGAPDDRSCGPDRPDRTNQPPAGDGEE